jgi:CRISPR-associated endonuclease/helicase Cas3
MALTTTVTQLFDLKKLLAKSVRADNNSNDSEALTLPGHSELGIIAGQTFQEIAAVVCQQLELKLTPTELIQTVVLAIWLHDWGKANRDFQAMVQRASKLKLLKQWFCIAKKVESCRVQQLIRHELLSVILARHQPVRTWLSKAESANFNIALVAVLGHHLKVKNSSYFEVNSGSLELYTDSEDFQKTLQLGCKYLGLDTTLPQLPRQFKENELKTISYQLGGNTDSWFVKLDNSCKGDLDKLKKIAVVKALVMAADLAASALLEKERGSRTYTDWIKDALAEVMTASELQQVIDQRLGNKPLLDFQKEAAQKNSRVLIVQAGCGAGKSIVPFCLFKRLAEEKQLKAKVFFCYPTTATTSQGFADYAVPTEIENTLLMHSRAWVDEQLKGLLDTYDDDPDSDPVANFQTKVEALKLWHSKLVYCTAHTVLGLFKNHRKGIYGFPGIVQGAFVFDEIHAYPPKLFGTLLQFLRVFRDARIVLMSASLTQQQLEAIQNVLAEFGESAEVVTGPKEIEELPRYNIASIASEELAWDEAIAELKNKGKVLWITNQVADSQRIYTEAVDRFKDLPFPIQTLVYHSRFRYEDAHHQHDKLIAAFRGDNPAFAVTTQIAEMSLDISATLLVSANAPIWALIQRLGRLNRWVDETKDGYKLRTGKVCKALIYPWNKEQPYKLEELKTGIALVDALAGKVVDQVQLAEQISQISLKTPSLEESQWLQTWQATQGELMPPGYTIQAVLADDVEKIFKSSNKPSLEAQKWAVSVRIQKGKTEKWEQNKAFKFYRVAPTEDVHYHPEIGAYSPEIEEFLKIRYGHKT